MKSPTKSKGRGRPRLTAEDVEARIEAYCARYGVTRKPDGLPPFPTGQRETQQHRDWIAVYKAHKRLPVPPAATKELRGLLRAQNGRCPICAEALDISDGVADRRANGTLRGLLHAHCIRLVNLAEALDLEATARLRAYLWPGGSP